MDISRWRKPPVHSHQTCLPRQGQRKFSWSGAGVQYDFSVVLPTPLSGLDHLLTGTGGLHRRLISTVPSALLNGAT